MKLFLFSALFSLLAAVYTEAAPEPVPATSPYQHLQAKRAEINARQAHPELFEKRQGTSPISPPTCPDRRRSLNARDAPLQILSAEEMAAFLKGRGSFTSTNGTHYHDAHYAYDLYRQANSRNGLNRWYNVVKDTLGNKLLEISIPHYKKWKNTLVHGDVFHLSATTAMRAEDVDKLEELLINDPEFEDVQVWGFRINRRFFEVANSY